MPPATGPDDVENFFPTTLGSSWNYYATTSSTPGGAQTNFMDAVTVTGTQAVNGQTATVFTDANPSGSGTPSADFFLKNGGGLAYLGSSGATGAVAPNLAPYLLALLPVSPGTVANFSRTGVNFGADLDGDGIDETADVTVTNTIDGFQPLDIALGSFPRSVQATEHVSGTVTLSKSKSSVPFSGSTTRWLVPGIGVLKVSQTATAQSGNAAITATEQLTARGYVTSDGTTTVAHGFGVPYTVSGNIPPIVAPVDDLPALATDGQNFLAVTEDASGLTAFLFDAQCQLLASPGLAAGAGSSFPVAAFDGTNYWAIFSPYSNIPSGSVTTCFAQRISATGTVLDASPINLVTVGGPYASIGSTGFAFGNVNGLLAFSEFNLSTSQHELHGVLVNPDGTVAGAGAFAIATDNSTHLNPAIAFDGTNFLVTWMQLPTSGATVGSIYGTRVSPTGTVVDAAPILISDAPNGSSSPAVAFDGTNYLVVWLDLRNQTLTTPAQQVYGARVTTGGALLDGPAASGGFSIGGGTNVSLSAPSVVFNGTEYLVTWNVLGYANSGAPGVQAARVSASGTLPSGPNTAIMVSGPPGAAPGTHLAGLTAVAGPQRAAVIWFDISSAKALRGATFSPL